MRISSESNQEDELQRVIQMSREEHELEEALRRSMMEAKNDAQSNQNDPTAVVQDSPEIQPSQEEIRSARSKFLDRF